MNVKPYSLGHLAAFATIMIWGTTFISTKILLRDFTPVEILFSRFVIGYIALLMFYPKRLKINKLSQEWLFIAAGISGITLYYLLENIALTFTTASNVGIIITVAPLFTALLACWLLKTEKPTLQFYIGFLAAITGIILISYNGDSNQNFNLIGDVLALLAAATWAIYSILIKKIGKFGYNTTRRTFFYGLLFMLPVLLFTGFSPDIEKFTTPVNLGNILFLGLGASALCFVSWNMAVKLLGAIKTSVYIYLVPVVTVATSAVILNEPLTPILITGALLTLSGLWLSETKIFDGRKTITRQENCIQHND